VTAVLYNKCYHKSIFNNFSAMSLGQNFDIYLLFGLDLNGNKISFSTSHFIIYFTDLLCWYSHYQGACRSYQTWWKAAWLLRLLNTVAWRQTRDVGCDSSQHPCWLLLACHIPLCRWHCWNCFRQKGPKVHKHHTWHFPANRFLNLWVVILIWSWFSVRGRPSFNSFF